jgi:hypothetical protein
MDLNKNGFEQKWIWTKMDSNKNGFEQRWIRTKMDSNKDGFEQRWIRTKMDSNKDGFEQRWIRTKMDSNKDGFEQKWIRTNCVRTKSAVTAQKRLYSARMCSLFLASSFFSKFFVQSSKNFFPKKIDFSKLLFSKSSKGIFFEKKLIPIFFYLQAASIIAIFTLGKFCETS